MIAELYKNILKKERLLDLDVFIKDYQTFEEIPLISRYQHLAFLDGKVKKEYVQLFLINVAFFLLNNIELYARSNLSVEQYMNYFVCITFSDIDDNDACGYAIPNILVTRKSELFRSLNVIRSDSFAGFDRIRIAFDQCGLTHAFKLVGTVSRDKHTGELARVYAIDHSNVAKLDALSTTA
jgi:hypothetical protein